MGRSLIISEDVNLAALMDKGKAIEFFLQSKDFSLGDIYSARVENILPSIDAVFVNIGSDKMGFLHASDIPGAGPLTDRVWPRQKLLVQIVKEPTSNKGPRVSTDITLIGRFFVLTTEHENIVMSRRITSANERARLKSIATLLKPPVGFGLVIRTEAIGATDRELEEDFRELFIERWKYIIDQFEIQRRPGVLFSDSKDLMYKTLRDVFHDGVTTVAVDNEKAAERAKHYLDLWTTNPPEVDLKPARELLKEYGVVDELKHALFDRVELPSGGYLHIQPTEALTVIDVNSGKFTSSSSPGETILKTNMEAASEAARQMRLRNIGGVIVIDFIDMESKFDRLKVLEHFERLLETDPAHPQIGRLSDLGLVELTRHRQEKSLFESLGDLCDKCHGVGWVFPIFQQLEEPKQEEIVHDNPEEANESEENLSSQDSLPSVADLENQLIAAPPSKQEHINKETLLEENSVSSNENPSDIVDIPRTDQSKNEAADTQEEDKETNSNQLESKEEKVEKEEEEEEIELPTLSLGDNSTKEVLPGIYSFEDNK
ncbi:MAG: Rne/Rng family ribonuclease [Candidatus Caenarcaniphilales bacterium]|nr:Rne/Rng family ribonuclease [Candidatus Caenarcaniphilales bacterium]